MTAPATLTSRREFLFCYDIKMGNPNGDPDENRPRVLPDKTHYVTDVRLKRFVRDYLKLKGHDILVDKIDEKTTNLTGRVAAYLAAQGIEKVQEAAQTVNILLNAFIDARMFGSSFAFAAGKAVKKGDTKGGGEDDTDSEKPEKKEKKKGEKLVGTTVQIDGRDRKVEWAPPKTLTGAVQIMHGEVKHEAREVDIPGTSIFASGEDKSQGTFTTYFALRYALIAFNGIANEHGAKLSRLTDADYALMLRAMWDGVRAAANTRTKRGQVPRLLLNVVYKPGNEFQYGNLADYLKLAARTGKAEQEWSSPDDYTVDVSRLVERLGQQASRVARLETCLSPDVVLSQPLEVPGVEVVNLDFDAPGRG